MTTKRTQARQAALQLLFMHDQNDSAVREDVLRYLTSNSRTGRRRTSR